MSTIFPNKRKSKKFLSIVYENKQQKIDQQFIRSYSQLLNKHFSQSLKLKSSLRRPNSSSLGLKNKKANKVNSAQNSPKKKNSSKHQNHMDRFNFINSNAGLNKSVNQSCLQKQGFISNNSATSRRIQLNPETNQKIEQILLSKTQIIQQNSHQNVILNKKLQQSTQEKKLLMNLMENLRMQILRQKKSKSKISTNMGKLMNKIEQANNMIRKTEEERFFIMQETKLVEKEFQIENRKNQQLRTISETNQEKIRVEKELIDVLMKKNQSTKTEILQTKTHLNEIKEIYMRDNKCLMKVEMNYNQADQQRDLLFKTVKTSVSRANQKPKV